MKALRLKKILHTKLSFPSIFSISSIHNLIKSILPFYIGELSFPLMYKKLSGEKFSKGLTAIIFARFLDILLISLVSLVTLNIVKLDNATFAQIRLWINILSIISITILAALIITSPKSLLYKHPLGKKIYKLADYILEMPKVELLKLITITTLQWSASYTFSYLAFKSIGLSIPFEGIILAVSLGLLISALPIQTPAGLGTLESAWGIVLLAYGFTVQQALEISLSMHILVYLNILAIGLVGGSLYLLQEKQTSGVQISNF